MEFGESTKDMSNALQNDVIRFEVLKNRVREVGPIITSMQFSRTDHIDAMNPINPYDFGFIRRTQNYPKGQEYPEMRVLRK